MKNKFGVLIIGSMLLQASCVLAVEDSTVDSNQQISMYTWIEVEGIENGRIKFDVLTGTIVDAETTITFAQIPDQICGTPVIAIGSLAFAGCDQLQKVVIPEEVSYIGDLAFANCGSLNVIYFPGNKDQWEVVASAASLSKATAVECDILAN